MSWTNTTLGAVLTDKGYIRGPFGSALKRDEMKENGIPVYEQKNAIYGSRDFRFFIDNEKFQELKRFQVKTNDLIISCSGTVGKISIISEGDPKGIISQALLILRPNIDKVILQYLYYVLSSKQGFELITQASHGSVQINIAERKVVENIPLLLPSVSEQKSIATMLSCLDKKIDLLNRQNKTLEAVASTLFRQWFVEEAQEDWEEVSLGDYVELNRISIDKGYPHQTIEYLDTGSLTEGKIEGFQSLNLNEAPSRAKRLVQNNDILISTVRPDQKHYGIIKKPVDNLVVSTGFCVLTCTKIDPHFIYLLLTNDEMTDYLHTIAEGSTTTYPSLKPSDIGAIFFQMPPDERLKEFAAIAHDFWEKIEKNYIQISTLEKLRDTLLPKLMSGDVRMVY